MYDYIKLPYNAKVTNYYGCKVATVQNIITKIDRDSDIGMDLEAELLERAGIDNKYNHVVFTVNFGYTDIHFWCHDFEIIIGMQLQFN